MGKLMKTLVNSKYHRERQHPCNILIISKHIYNSWSMKYLIDSGPLQTSIIEVLAIIVINFNLKPLIIILAKIPILGS